MKFVIFFLISLPAQANLLEPALPKSEVLKILGSPSEVISQFDERTEWVYRDGKNCVDEYYCSVMFNKRGLLIYQRHIKVKFINLESGWPE